MRIDLVHRAQPLDKMRRRINVRAPLPDMRKDFAEKSRAHRVGTLVVPVDCLAGFIWKTGPGRNTRRKLMRKIDIFFADQRLLNRPERSWVAAKNFANRKETRGAQTN